MVQHLISFVILVKENYGVVGKIGRIVMSSCFVL
jgi:hypothetical protein